jgi:hypothetical protein
MPGYYRYPEVQTAAGDVCVNQISDTSTPEAARFQDAIGQASQVGTTLRVAVGDNFAPFLLSRQLWIDKDPKKPGEADLDEKENYLDVATLQPGVEKSGDNSGAPQRGRAA